MILLLFLAFPANVCLSQTETLDVAIQADVSGSTETKSDKKKDKDVIEINAKFFISLGINLITVALIILLIYFPNYRKMDFIFTFLIFNIGIFLLTFVLNKVKISLGAAFGLFAVFSMLRYRTAGISQKDMTYLFIFIAMGLISAIQLEYSELLIINGIIFLGTFFLDSKWIFRREMSKTVQYENIELIKPEKKAELMEDLKKRTGLKIHRLVINKVDFLKDTASIRIYYFE